MSRFALPLFALLALPMTGHAACNTAGLTSAQTDQARVLVITNRSDAEVLRLYWIDFSGAATLYTEIAPRAQIEQPTFTSHVWAIEGDGGACKAVLLVDADIDIGVR
ncbi:hypothetical protein OU426_05565 [Frigidibacter sp. RF13]|uniref:VHL beta domain-containing protein n=1 Tax=Frigidibacter sp. RF13 TaxID=2997340 RepID=UPI00227223A5|nr:hypothetical protein [Frigidibacter sp. RF13]MCY1126318.1 hypothetical protein [Frigidibacter sp. RF13]